MNLGPETRNGYYISAEMKKVWAVEIKLLNKLLDVCKKNNLKIWAEGGTLLGTVREHGFIPWDDDIDMAMPREDFDKLQIIADKEFKSPFFFQTGHTDLFPNGIAKLRMDGTSAIERVSLFCNQHQGIFIDIFPLDVMPTSPKESLLFIERAERLKKNLDTYCYHSFSLTDWYYNIKLLTKILKIRLKGFHICFKEFEDFVKKYSQTGNEILSFISWFYRECDTKHSSWYNETIYLPFENINIPVPIGYKKILEKEYGDYMTPKQEPSMHESFIFLSTEKPYQDIIAELRHKYKIEIWRTRLNLFLKLIGYNSFCK